MILHLDGLSDRGSASEEDNVVSRKLGKSGRVGAIARVVVVDLDMYRRISSQARCISACT